MQCGGKIERWLVVREHVGTCLRSPSRTLSSFSGLRLAGLVARQMIRTRTPPLEVPEGSSVILLSRVCRCLSVGHITRI
jgi:hypothetical protein